MSLLSAEAYQIDVEPVPETYKWLQNPFSDEAINSGKIKWDFQSIIDDGLKSNVAISYVKNDKSEPNYNFDRCPVRISHKRTIPGKNDEIIEVIFIGVVMNYSVSNERIFLNAVGFGNMLDNLLNIGAFRQHLGMNATAFSMFNERGQADAMFSHEVNDDGIDIDPEQNPVIPIGNLKKEKWRSIDIAKYFLKNIYPTSVSPDEVRVDLDLSNVDVQDFPDLESDYIIRTHLMEEIQLAAASGFMIARFDYPENVFESELTPEIIFHGAMSFRSKTLQGNQFPFKIDYSKTVDSVDMDTAPFSISVNVDASTPSKLFYISGRTHVTTMVRIRPDNIDQEGGNQPKYTTLSTNNDGTGITATFEHVSEGFSDDLIFDSVLDGSPDDNRLDNLMRSCKSNLVQAVFPRIENYDDIFLSVAGARSEPKFLDTWEFWFKFKQTDGKVAFMDNDRLKDDDLLSVATGQILFGSTEWEQMKEYDEEDFLWFIENQIMPKVTVSQDNIKVTMGGFSTDNDENEDPFGFFNFDNFKDIVEHIEIPMTFLIDERQVYVILRDDKAAGAEEFLKTQTIQVGVNTKNYIQPVSHSEHFFVDDSISQLVRVNGFSSFSPGAGIIKETDIIPINNEVAIKGKAELARRIFDDNTNITIKVPREIYFQKLTDNFPRQIGEGLGSITDDPNGLFAGFALPRPVFLTKRAFTDSDVVLSFK